MKKIRRVSPAAFVVLAGLALLAFNMTGRVDAQQAGAPRYIYDPEWPKPLPKNWKIGGITGLAVDRNDDVWVLNRPNDLTNIELHAELMPTLADCCTRPPSMIHISKTGDILASFDAPQGHGMDVDSKGFVYIGQNTVRKYDPKSGQIVATIARAPETEGGGQAGVPQLPKRVPGQGGRGAVVGFLPDPPGTPGPSAEQQAKQQAAQTAFRKKYPPETGMILGGIEEIRIDEPNNEIYVADSYLGGRVLIFDLNTFAFKRGWGAYGKPLKEISINDATRDYKPGGPMAKDFVGHLTLNFSNDGLVYAADRVGNRIHVTDKQGKFIREIPLGVNTGVGGSPGGVAFSPDKEQRYMFISDLTNNRIWFLNRADGKVLGQLGRMGEEGGQFYGLHMIAVDSRGTIYTGEVFAGQRVQRFVPAASPRGKVLDQLAKTPLF